MKLIFLDIDGVLNIMSKSYSTFMKDEGEHIEHHLVMRLNYIIEKTQAKIVISSSWRSTMDDLKEQMEKVGFIGWKNVIGRTPLSIEMKLFKQKESEYRGNQIFEWLHINQSNNDNINYVVLEDEPNDVCGDKCNIIPKERVVWVDINEGISNQNVLDTIELLNQDFIVPQNIPNIHLKIDDIPNMNTFIMNLIISGAIQLFFNEKEKIFLTLDKQQEINIFDDTGIELIVENKQTIFAQSKVQVIIDYVDLDD